MGFSFLRAGVLAAAAAVSAACGANHHSIYRHQPVAADAPSVTLVDAKQRAVLAGANGQDGVTRFCSEPSPDVFAVIAQSLAAGGSFGQGGADPGALQVALNLAFSSSEQASSIPRTQTINMLRELMFRTCERYLGGGYNPLELSVQAVRDQRLMVSILAIEQLTGAVTPKPVVIGASGEASAGASGAEAAVRLDEAYKDWQNKTAAEQKRQTEFDELNGEAKECDAIAKLVADKEEDKLTPEQTKKRPKCEKATSDLAAAKKLVPPAAAHYEAMKKSVEQAGIPVAASTGLMTSKAEGDLARAHSNSVASIADVVENIVQANFEQDEFLFFCMKLMAPGDQLTKSLSESVANAKSLLETCIRYVERGIDAQAARQGAYLKARADYDATVDVMFEAFWRRVSSPQGTLARDKLDLILADRERWPDCVHLADTKEAWRRCYKDSDMTSGMQRQLQGGR